MMRLQKQMSKIKMKLKEINDTINVTKIFLRLSTEYDRWYLLYYFPLMMVNAITPFVGIVFPKYIIDSIQDKKNFGHIIVLVIAMFVFRFVLSSISQVLFSICEKKMINIRTGMRVFLNEKSLSLEYEKLETPVYLDMKLNAVECIDKNYDIGFVARNIVTFCSAIMTLLGLMAIISTLNIWTIILIVFVACINGFAKSKQAKKTHFFRKRFSKMARKLFYIIGVTWDYKYAKEIKCFNLSDWLNEKKQNLLKEFSGNNIRIFILSAITTLTSIITSCMQTLVVYINLVVEVFKNAITIGDFSMYLVSISQFSTTLSSMINSCVSIAEALPYFKDYVSFCSLKSNYKTLYQKAMLSNHYEIEFRNVTFSYPGQNTAALNNVSVKIKQNEKISIVGENGAGKSTFIKLLMRLYKPTSGKILLNGIDIQEIDLASYTKLISVVFQDYKIFAFSLKENICGYDENNAKLDEVIKSIGLKKKIDNMKNGYNTTLSREFDVNGIELSGGEQQKVAIAQALYKNAPIIVLDEPTSNLSPIAEYELYTQFSELAKSKTAIFISHRLSSCKFCDRIVVFDKGEIIESGSHDELMRLQGVYSSMFITQAQYYFDLDQKQ